MNILLEYSVSTPKILKHWYSDQDKTAIKAKLITNNGEYQTINAINWAPIDGLMVKSWPMIKIL